VQTKEWWNAELKGIFPYSLGEGVWPISKQTKLAVGSSEAFLLQMQPHFVAHLEVVWHPMLIMSLLVLSIGFVQDVMNLLVDVLNVLNEVVCLIFLRLDMSLIFLSSHKWHGYVNGT
jgi:hypothetical protein